MLGDMPAVAFVPCTDLARARAFYEGVLGLTVTTVDSYAVVLRAGAAMLRVTQVDDLTPQPFTVLGWLVPDIRAAVTGLGERGVAFTRYDGMEQDRWGIWSSPGGAKIAWFRDPDGNTLSLTEL
jgi:catechol 2,3-dioxygenase-like lactoylglutathione lyase family enzyme